MIRAIIYQLRHLKVPFCLVKYGINIINTFFKNPLKARHVPRSGHSSGYLSWCPKYELTPARKTQAIVGFCHRGHRVHSCQTSNIFIKCSILKSPFWLNARTKIQHRHWSWLWDISCSAPREGCTKVLPDAWERLQQGDPCPRSGFHKPWPCCCPSHTRFSLTGSLAALCHRYIEVFPFFQLLMKSESWFKPGNH